MSFVFDSEYDNPDLLRRALDRLFLHHDGLRAAFSKTGDVWTKEIRGEEWVKDAFSFEHVDLSSFEPGVAREMMNRWFSFNQTALDICNGPLGRFVFFWRVLVLIHCF